MDLSPLKGIEAVKGDVKVRDNAGMTDLSFLHSLGVVEGNVEIVENPDLVSASALDWLETVSGDLIVWNNAALTGLPSFSRLTTLGGLSITDNPVLADVSGFNSVTSTMDQVYVRDNGPMSEIAGLSQVPAVEGLVEIQGVAGSVRILGAAQDAGHISINMEGSELSSFGSLHLVKGPLFVTAKGLQSVGGSFGSLVSVVKSLHLSCTDCGATPMFSSLSTLKVEDQDWTGLPGLYVTLESSSGLPTATAPPFSALVEVDGYVDVDLSSVADTSLALFPSLQAVWGGALYVKLSDAVTTLSGFEALDGVQDGIHIQGGQGLVTVDGFGALTSTMGLKFEGPLLAQVPNFDALVEVGDRLSGFPEDSLAYLGTLPEFGPALEAYPTMASLTVAGYLRLWNNDAMTDFDGLTGLQQIQTLDLGGCSDLTAVTGLTSLKQVGGLYTDDPFPSEQSHGSLKVGPSPLSDVSGLAALQEVENDLVVLVCDGDPMAMKALTSVGGTLSVCADPDHYCQAEDWLDGISKGSGTLSGSPPEDGCD